MRRQTPIAHLLYSYLYPNPSANDPASFSAHLARNLVPEVRVEVATFYGDLNSVEARYPGLNYCYPPHRMRLGRFKYHRRLFEAFDTLGLTYNEIQDFCCWEGTKWARERYEKDEGVKVEDTTGDEIGPFVDRRERADRSSAGGSDEGRRCSITRKTDISVVVEDADAPSTLPAVSSPLPPQDEEMSEDDAEASTGTSTSALPPAPTTTSSQPPADTILPITATHDSRSWLEQSQRAGAPDRRWSQLYPQSSHNQHQQQQQQRQHSLQSLARRRGDPELSQWLATAWSQGQELPPEIEQYLKDATERGISVDAASATAADLAVLLAARPGPSPPSSATATAAAPRFSGSADNSVASRTPAASA